MSICSEFINQETNNLGMPMKDRKQAAKKEFAKKDIRKRPDAERRLNQDVRLSRAIRVLELIQGRGRWNATSLAKEVDASERSIYRDLAALELAGVPYYFDQTEQCYRVRPGYRLPITNLTTDELLDQTTANAVAQAHAVPLSGAKTATIKLKSASTEENAKLLDEAERLTSVLDLKLADHSQHQQSIKAIQWAMLEQTQLTGQYASPYQDKPVRLHLHPYRVCFAGQSWYLIARPNDGDTPRTYRVPRFQSLRALQRPAEVPKEFNLNDYFGNAWSVYRGNETYSVELEFTAEAAPLVLETTWHHTQVIKKKYKDGRTVLGFTVDGLQEIVWWVLGWSGGVKVIQPNELREMLIRELRAALEMNCEPV